MRCAVLFLPTDITKLIPYAVCRPISEENCARYIAALRQEEAVLSNAFTCVERLNQASSTDEVMDSIQSALEPFGFEYFSFFTLPRLGRRFEELRIATRLPPEWLEIYIKEQYVHVSPAVRQCMRAVRPFEWKNAPYDPEREPRAAQLINLMTEFGLSNSILVPIPGPTGCEGCAWLGGVSTGIAGTPHADDSSRGSLCIRTPADSCKTSAACQSKFDAARAGSPDLGRARKIRLGNRRDSSYRQADSRRAYADSNAQAWRGKPDASRRHRSARADDRTLSAPHLW